MSPLPAHQTKHLRVLLYPFADSHFQLQQLDNGDSNGTALWLSAQCLASFLAEIHTKFRSRSYPGGKRLKAVELGSGIGLTAVVLRSLGWDVLATDIPDVISTVLHQNVQNNTVNCSINPSRSQDEPVIQVKELDWSVHPNQWIWDNEKVIASSTGQPSSSLSTKTHLQPPFDLIISSDTIYDPALTRPLLRTLHALSIASLSASARTPPIYLCIERRDPALIDQTFQEARDVWKFSVSRIPTTKLIKAMRKGGIKWAKADWEDVEIWKLTLLDGKFNLP